MGLDPFAELCVFLARARHHTDEAPAALVDVVHGLAGTEFGVGYIEKVGPARGLAQGIPALLVRARVAGIAMLAAKLYRHPAVIAGGEDKQQLFEVGAVVFGVTVGDVRGALAAHLAPAGLGVLAAEAHAGRVVMQLLERHVKRAHGAEHHIGQQRRAVGIKQTIQGTSHGIVARVLHRCRIKPERLRCKGADRLLLAIQGFALDEHRAQDNPQGLGIGQTNPPVVGWDETLKTRFEVEAFEEVIDQG
jgi:hypothetical protein